METIYRSKLPNINIPNHLLLHSYTLENISQFNSNPSIINPKTGQTFTYSQLNLIVRRLAAGLLNLGIKQGQTIMLLLPNSPEFIFSFLAASSLGAITTSANPTTTSPTEILNRAKSSNTTLIITQFRHYQKINNIINNTVKIVTFENINVHNFDQNDVVLPNIDIDQNDVVLVSYTSGTTGVPKGVMLTHKGLVTNISQVIDGANPNLNLHGGNGGSGGDVVLCAMPLELIERYKVSILPVVPPIVVAVTKFDDLEKYNLSSVRTVIAGAAPLGKVVEDNLRNKFPNAKLGIWDDRGRPVMACSLGFAKQTFDIKSGGCGSVIRNAQMKLVDPQTGASLPMYQQPGEICVKGDQIMKGYLNDPEGTKKSIDKQGWLHTGDIGIIDKDGELFIIDRSKELTNYNGNLVAPAQLEALLFSHSHISDAAVVSIKDEKKGELPVAFVVKSNTYHITEDEIKQYISQQVDSYKRIEIVFFIDAIPKTQSGKILRKDLRKKLAGWFPN